MAHSRLGKADRFYRNPALRDAEWNQATQPPWWLIVAVLGFVVVGFFAGVYTSTPCSLLGWLAGTVAILIYLALDRLRRGRARRQLGRAHGQM